MCDENELKLIAVIDQIYFSTSFVKNTDRIEIVLRTIINTLFLKLKHKPQEHCISVALIHVHVANYEFFVYMIVKGTFKDQVKEQKGL